MHAQVPHMRLHWAHNELYILRGHLLNALLNHVVPILVEYALKDCVFQLTHQKDLLLQAYVFQCPLYNPAPVHTLSQL